MWRTNVVVVGGVGSVGKSPLLRVVHAVHAPPWRQKGHSCPAYTRFLAIGQVIWTICSYVN
jgi:hypothetical protein